MEHISNGPMQPERPQDVQQPEDDEPVNAMSQQQQRGTLLPQSADAR